VTHDVQEILPIMFTIKCMRFSSYMRTATEMILVLIAPIVKVSLLV